MPYSPYNAHAAATNAVLDEIAGVEELSAMVGVRRGHESGHDVPRGVLGVKTR
jgi:hypothetical protein